MTSDKDIVITGLPRSGTTLTCHLLGGLPNVIALHEPMKPPQKRAKALAEVQQFFTSTRSSILENKRAPSVAINGEVPDNMFAEERNKNGLRSSIQGCGLGEIKIDKVLDNNFTLCVKHNGLFACILNDLLLHFSCYGIIRNPLAVLASWNSVQLPISNGHMPVAERLDEELRDALISLGDKYDRQIYILNWFFERFSSHLPDENIIRYEDVIMSGGQNLACIDPKAEQLPQNALNSKNKNSLYDQHLMTELSSRLIKAKDATWHDYYSVDDIKRVAGLGE